MNVIFVEKRKLTAPIQMNAVVFAFSAFKNFPVPTLLPR